MKINVVMPKQISYIEVLLRTKKFYHLKRMTDVIADEYQRYYIFIRKGNMQIKIVRKENESIGEIQKYLNYTFRNSYLGIYKEDYEKIQLQGVRKVRMYEG